MYHKEKYEMDRYIKLDLAIKTVEKLLEENDVPYKDIGYENHDYEHDEDTPTPKCYTIRFHTMNYIHIDILEEKYVVEDAWNFGTDEYIKVFDNFTDLKIWILHTANYYKQALA